MRSPICTICGLFLLWPISMSLAVEKGGKGPDYQIEYYRMQHTRFWVFSSELAKMDSYKGHVYLKRLLAKDAFEYWHLRSNKIIEKHAALERLIYIAIFEDKLIEWTMLKDPLNKKDATSTTGIDPSIPEERYPAAVEDFLKFINGLKETYEKIRPPKK